MTKPSTADSEKMLAVLARMLDLLEAYGQRSWAEALSDLGARQGTEDVRGEIRRLYGGMGSLNDLVLHSADIARMRADNNEFDALRKQLSELCR